MTRTVLTPKALLLRALRRMKAFGRDRSGATAVEFALLSIPFFALIAAIVETALLFFAGQVLDSAVRDTSRLILTGQATSLSAETFKQAMCNRLYGFFDCAQLRVRVSTVSSFSTAQSTYPLDTTTGEFKPDWDQTVYQPGSASSVIMVEAYYKAPVMLLNFSGYNMQNTPDGKRLLSAVRIFQNEL